MKPIKQPAVCVHGLPFNLVCIPCGRRIGGVVCGKRMHPIRQAVALLQDLMEEYNYEYSGQSLSRIEHDVDLTL
jgi:hypothetical protein